MKKIQISKSLFNSLCLYFFYVENDETLNASELLIKIKQELARKLNAIRARELYTESKTNQVK